MPARIERILVIKHGALGDFIQAQGAFQAIRAAHVGQHLTLLTTAAFSELAVQSRLFDDVWVDLRPKFWQVSKLAALAKKFRASGFSRVYDLQTSARSSWYFELFPRHRRPQWSGISRGCSHPHANPDRDRMHTLGRLAEQLEIAGIRHVPPPDLSWMRSGTASAEGFGVGENFMLLAPGGSVHRPAKRWPEAHFAKLARGLCADRVTPVVIGQGLEEARLAQRIADACPSSLNSGVVNLVGQTSLSDLAVLARRARAAIGNDTGPMQLTAAVGCPTVVLFGHASDPQLCAPRGEKVKILRGAPIDGISVEDVTAALADLTQSERAPTGHRTRRS
jgi:ADP-heptose:LPS heptosyltransferase